TTFSDATGLNITLGCNGAPRGSAAGNGLLCRLGCDEIAHAGRESGLNDTPAAQNVGARVFFLVTEAAAGSALSSQRQLAGGKSSRTKSGCNHGYEQRGFESFHCVSFH